MSRAGSWLGSGWRHALAMATIALTALAATACGGSSSSSSASSGSKTAGKGPITACLIAATSGPLAQLGTLDIAGVTAWADYVNSHGGVLGHRVKIVKENDASSPATAASLARKCVTQDGAQFIFGPEETATTSGALPIINQLDTVAITLQSGWNANGYSNANLHGWAFPAIGNVFHADDQAFAKFVIEPRHLTRVAVIQDNAPGGLGNDTYTAALGKTGGFSVVASQTVTPGSTNDTPAVLKLLAAHPQAIVLGMIPGPDTITALKAIRAQNPTIPIGECSGCTLPSFIAATGGYSTMKDVYVIGTPQELVASTPRTAQYLPGIQDTATYISAMDAAGYSSPDFIDAGSPGWDGGRELQAAIEAANSTSPSAVRAALQHQTIAVGGLQAYFYSRTPQNYGNVTQIVSPMSVVQPNGSLKVFKSGSFVASG
jgi:branched-chain amino acid transport system substrate-binding protein